jgi:hypothetical protein
MTEWRGKKGRNGRRNASALAHYEAHVSSPLRYEKAVLSEHSYAGLAHAYGQVNGSLADAGH